GQNHAKPHEQGQFDYMLGQFSGESTGDKGHLPSGHAFSAQAALKTMGREQGKAPNGVVMDISLVSEVAEGSWEGDVGGGCNKDSVIQSRGVTGMEIKVIELLLHIEKGSRGVTDGSCSNKM
ncbi:hypothetical protein HAX54_007202, partial [Datura stramonium]|nr:hypothetical protein [Datura stramonium]